MELMKMKKKLGIAIAAILSVHFGVLLLSFVLTGADKSFKFKLQTSPELFASQGYQNSNGGSDPCSDSDLINTVVFYGNNLAATEKLWLEELRCDTSNGGVDLAEVDTWGTIEENEDPRLADKRCCVELSKIRFRIRNGESEVQ